MSSASFGPVLGNSALAGWDDPTTTGAWESFELGVDRGEDALCVVGAFVVGAVELGVIGVETGDELVGVVMVGFGWVGDVGGGDEIVGVGVGVAWLLVGQGFVVLVCVGVGVGCLVCV